MKTVAFFNNKGGVGKTTLVHHLAWVLSDFGKRVIVADLDPQSNLSAAFLDESQIEELWPEGTQTVYGAVSPLVKGTGDISAPHIEKLNDKLSLIIGDLSLSRFEDELSQNWPDCLDRKERAFRVITAFWRLIENAAINSDADVVFIDVGPNLGAINRSAMIAANFVVVPMAPDIFSLQGLRNLGPTLRTWRSGWEERLKKAPSDIGISLPKGEMRPVGYIVMRHAIRLHRPTKAFERWIARIPTDYRKFVMNEQSSKSPAAADDPYCLAILKDYHSLMPLAHEKKKPVFHLTQADGAIASHFKSVWDARAHFSSVAGKIAERIGMEMNT